MTNVTILGLSRAGFRIKDVVSASGYTRVKTGTSASINIDDHKTEWVLWGERGDNFIRTLPQATFTVSIATPGVVTSNAHGLVVGDIVKFTTTGALPTGLTVGTKYYVVVSTTNTFQVSATYGGSAINTTGSQSGTHTFQHVSANIVGLNRFGFRIKNSGGTKSKVKVGAVVQVDLTDGGVIRNLRRNKGMFFVSTSATSLALRGISPQQRGFNLQADETATITGSNSGNATNGSTVTVGAKVYTIKTNLTEVKASGTITTSSTGAANNDTVTVGAVTYTFKTTLTGAANEVLRDGTEDDDLTNLAAAINGSAGAGTTYGTGTVANPAVSSSAVAAHAVTVTALSPGTAGNSLALTKTGSILTVSGSGTLSGGVNSVANEVHIGGSADATLTNLVNAINYSGGTVGTDYSTATTANADFTASGPTSHVITFTEKNPGVIVETISTTETTYTAAGVGGGIAKVYRLQTTTIDPSKPTNYKQLRREYRNWIEA